VGQTVRGMEELEEALVLSQLRVKLVEQLVVRQGGTRPECAHPARFTNANASRSI